MAKNKNMLWSAVWIALIFSAAYPRAGNASKKDGVMDGLIYKLLENATVVVFAKPVSVNPGGSDFACTHVFKGPVHITDSIQCTLPPSGKDTPELIQGREYLLFLHQDKNRSDFSLVNFSTVIGIPPERRAQIAEILHEYADIATIPYNIYQCNPGISARVEKRNYLSGTDLPPALAAEFTECKDGENTTIGIFEYDQDGNHDPMDKIEVSVTGNKLETEWKFVYQEDTDDILTDEEA
jgi:hypothetical protein